MRPKLELTIVICFFIAFIFLLGENPSITGLVIYGRGLIGENPGTYLFYPSMKASLDYDFLDYEKIKQKIGILIGSCADRLDLDLVDCVKNNLNRINDVDFDFYFKYNSNVIPEDRAEDWHEDCEKANESFFYDFVEFVDSCQNSMEVDCYCSMNIFDSGFEFKFDVLKEVNDLVFRYNDKIEKVKIKKTVNLQNSQKIKFNGGWGNDKVSINGIEFTKKIYMKNTPQSLYFIKDIDEKKDKRCKSENRHLKGCAISKKQKFIAKNPIKEGRSELRNVVTRFAFYLKDLPPPPVKEVNAFDKIKASASIMLNWSESEATDVIYYNIYYSDTNFEGKKTEELSGLNKVRVDVSSAKKVKSINIFNPMCQKLPEKRCKYLFGVERELMSEEIELSSGMLIYDEDAKSFIYVLPMENENEVFFGISAVDRKGQESEMIIKTDSAKSIDDLAPGKVAIVQLPLETNEYKLIWQRPPENIDGSELSIGVALTYDVYACKSLISSGSQLTSYPVGKTDCNDFKVIAIKGIYPERDSEEYKLLLE